MADNTTPEPEGYAKPSEGGEQQLSMMEPVAQLAVFRNWYRLDSAHCEPWHAQAKLDDDFAVGRQWTEDEITRLGDQKRAPVVFNRVLIMLKAVAGIEINSRHAIEYLPRTGDPDERGRIVVKANETLSAASQWMDDTADAEDHQSAAFQDTCKTGMGWSEARIGYEDEPKGRYYEQRVSKLEMLWDYRAREKNLTDAQRLWRKKRMLKSEARALFPDADAADLNCPWVLVGSDGKPVIDNPERRHKDEAQASEDDPQNEVTILQVQWWEYEQFWLVAHSGSPEEPEALSNDQYTALRKKVKEVETKAKAAGVAFDFTYHAAKARRKVYKQAFIGAKVLGKVTAPQDPTAFTFKCITGEPDENKGYWFGLVTLARDPQKFANLTLSQTSHILNSTAKGGVIAETDAFEDQQQAEKTYARPDAITWARPGAVSKNKIMQKPGAGIAAGHVNMLEFAISSIRDCLGINLELIGLRDANQPGILEAQRKQAAMTILATLFDSLRRFRKLIGRTRLQLIQRYLADGRMVRISGEDGHQLVKLLKQQVLGDYEIIVSDAPSAPNQKQETWGVLQGVLPMFKEMMTPEAAVIVLEYSPLPSKVVEAFKKLLQKPPPPEAQQAQAIAQAGAVAEVEATKAKTAKDLAQAEATKASAILDMVEAASRQVEGRLAAAQAQIVERLAAQEPARERLPDDMPVIEAPSVALPAPPAMAMPVETPAGPELPMALIETPPNTGNVI